METVNQDNVNNEETKAEESKGTENRTFTQEELNAIIDKRYAKMMEKYGDYDDLKAKAEKYDKIEEESKSELQKLTERAEKAENELSNLKKAESVRTIRDTVSAETGVPSHLLKGETEEECKAEAEDILKFAKPEGYPAVKDGGEVSKTSKAATRDQFADWLNGNQ